MKCLCLFVYYIYSSNTIEFVASGDYKCLIGDVGND